MDLDLRRNSILARLPSEELNSIEPKLEVVDVRLREPVYDPGRAITHVYFPLSCIFSLVALADGRVIVEIATIGREGMVGLPVFLGAASSPHTAFCQVAGRAALMQADSLRDAAAHDGALRRLLNRLTQATMVQVAQNVVCNRTHSSEQRAARWLLMTEDRIGRPEFALTQEFLAQMLGLRRPTVSETARRLQGRGLIRYSRGMMTISDRAGLERTTCDCYGIIKAEFDDMTRDVT